MECIIREYNDSDFEGLFRLLHEVYGTNINEEQLKLFYLGAEKKIIIAANAATGEPVGCAFTEVMTDYIRPDKVLFLTYVAVNEQYRGQRIGCRIMKYVEAVGKELQCNAIELTSANYRIGAHAFYKELGYSIKKTTHFIKEIQTK